MPSPKQLAKALAYRGEIRNTPQNSFLGGVANFLAPVSEFADRDKLPGSIPLLGGISAADVTGVKGAESLVRDMSYGKSPVRGATLNTVKVDPRLLDVAAVSGAMIPVGKALGKAALREGAKQIHTGTGVLGRNVMNPKMSVVPEGASMPQQPTGLLGHPKLNVLPNERVALVEGNSNLRVEHKPDGTFTISHSPAWGETGKPFTLNGDSVDDLISTAESRLQRSEAAMTAAAKSKHSKTVGGMLEMKHGDNFEYAKSARSDSQYITHTPTGAKIRISDHKLPDVYESPDFEVSGALSKKEQAQSISKFLDDYVTQRAKDDASIDVGGAMMQRPKTEFEILHDTAQRNAALPVEQGGLGLPEGNAAMDRAGAMGFDTDTPYYHGTNYDFDKFNTAGKKKTAGSGAFLTNNPVVAETYVGGVGSGGNIMPLLARKENLLEVNAKGRNWNDINTNDLAHKRKKLSNIFPDDISPNDFTTTDQIAALAPYADFSGALIKNIRDSGPSSHVFRSKEYLQDKYGIPNTGSDTYWNDVTGDQFAEARNATDKLYSNQRGDVLSLQNPQDIRSRFAAFDPMRRHEADILAGVGVGGMLDPQAIAEALRQQDRK